MTTAFARPKTVAGYGLGWKPDLPDLRDHLFAPDDSALTSLPAEVRLDADPAMPAPYDQGQLGSCTGNALAGAYEFQASVEGRPAVTPSRLFIYYGERVIEGTVNSDAGAQIRDGMKVLAAAGAPPETDWPYDVAAFRRKPPKQAYADAAAHKVSAFQRVARPINHWQAALAAKRPVVFGFSVYESFEAGDWPNYLLPMPERGEQLLGGHAVLAVGYATINGKLCVRVRNSWGTSWGDGGYFWMPAEYLAQRSLASDFWTIELVA